MTFLMECIQRISEIPFFCENVIGIEGGYREYADTPARQAGRYLCKDAYERKVQHALYAEGPPVVLPLQYVLRNQCRRTDQ